jgi:hypothetical protein
VGDAPLRGYFSGSQAPGAIAIQPRDSSSNGDSFDNDVLLCNCNRWLNLRFGDILSQ